MIAFIYNYQTGVEMFSPIGILWYKDEALSKYGKVSQYFFKFPETSGSEMHLSNLIPKVYHTWNYPMLQMYPLLMDRLSCFWQFWCSNA